MNTNKKWILVLVIAALMLTGCTMETTENMYCLPKRSEDYQNFQMVIDQAMAGMEYCSPLSGENQQTVQMADLDGDGVQEYLLFAKSVSEQSMPMRILIFAKREDTYVLLDSIESNGTSFDQVEYAPMDNKAGLEIVVGRQLSDQLLRSVSVYTLHNGEAEQLVSANYTKFLTVDLDMDALVELFVLRPGQTDTDTGIAELYGMEGESIERSKEVNMSGPAECLKRILVGQLQDVPVAVYAASTVEDTALITDVYAVVDGELSNVTFSNESGTSVQTLRNYYVYADDIDNDGVTELPSLTTMVPLDDSESLDRHDLIRWYSMTSDGAEIDKMYTYHSFVDGWYMELQKQLAPRLTAVRQGNSSEFYFWDENYETAQKIMTIYAFTGQNRDEQAREGNRFTLLKTDSVTYAAYLEAGADAYGLSQNSVLESFHLIHLDWKTGET